MTIPSSPARLSQSEYAKSRGWVKSYVSKLKAKGLLVMVDGLVDVAASDALIAQFRDPARGGNRSGRAGAAELPAAATTSAGVPTPVPAAPGKPAENSAGAALAYQEAATRERIAKARTAELELAEKAGQLLNRETVRGIWFTLARQAQQALLTMKYRLAGPLAIEGDPKRISEILDAEAHAIIGSIMTADPCKEAPEDEDE